MVFIDGSIVHFVHGNPGRAVLSLGLRVGRAVLGGYLGDMNETKNLGRIGLVQGAGHRDLVDDRVRDV